MSGSPQTSSGARARAPDEAARDSIVRWFCLAALRGVFKGGVETTINNHLRSVKASKKPAQGLFGALPANQSRPIKADELMREPTTLWEPFSQVMFAWLAAEGAKDWITGQPLAKIARLGHPSQRPEETLTIQHIFPRKLLADRQYAGDEANYPANFAIIGRSPNASLQDLPPTEASPAPSCHPGSSCSP